MDRQRYHSLANLGLLVACVAAGTWWVLELSAVRRPSQAPIALPTADPVARSRPLDTMPLARAFGATVATQSQASRARLVGVIAIGGTGRGIALLSFDGQPAMPLRVGEDAAEGATLVEVLADGVRLQRGAAVELLQLPPRVVPEGIAPERP